jgi:hypothetical protein
MPLVFRRLLFYFLVFLFLISAPLVILYTAGYRYNFKQHKILKTGAIMVTTDPKNANIFLNGHLRKEKTPARLLNLTPGQYTLRLEKKNYHPWQKNLKVESEQVTLIPNIILFKDALPRNIIEGEIYDFVFDSQNKILLYLKKEEGYYELWFKKGENNPLLLWRGTSSKKPKILDWNSKTEEILLQATDVFLFNLKQQTTSKGLEELTKKNWSKLALSQMPNLIFGLSGNNLSSLNVLNGVTDLLSQGVIDFSLFNKEIIFLQRDEREKKIKVKILKDGKETSLFSLPHGNYELKENSDWWLVIFNKQENNLYLISKNNKEEQIITIPGENNVWFKNEKPTMLAYSDFEIWSFDADNTKTELLTRLSEKIVDVLPHPSNNAFLVITETNVKALELDNAEEQNIYPLASFEKINQVQMDREGKILYIAGVKNKTSGLWKLEIR